MRRKLNEWMGYGRETRDRQMQFTEPARLRERASSLRLAAARNEHRAARLETSMERHHRAAAELDEKRAREAQRLQELEARFDGVKDQTSPSAAERDPDSPHARSLPDARSRLDRQKLRERIAAQRRRLAALEHRIAEHRTAAENRRAVAQQLRANATRDQQEAESVAREADESRGAQEAPPPRASPRLRP